jgi:replication factor C subunit 3/5
MSSALDAAGTDVNCHHHAGRRKLDDELRHKVIELAALYEHRLQEGAKAIFHLEGFVARFMSEYKTWSIQMLG